MNSENITLVRGLLAWCLLILAGGADATSPTKPPSASSPAYSIITHYYNDAVGSPLAATDSDGYVIWREEYSPYGERILRDPSAGQNHLWFTGHPHNEDSGLTYAGARHYDPMIGRFMSVDPVAVDAESSYTFNRYAYGNNNPHRYVDPTGEIPVDTLWDAASIVYDVGKITVGWTIGNQALVVEGSTDLIADGIALAVPYLPAGSTKLARASVETIDSIGDASKAARGTTAAPKEIGILRDALRGKGNFGLGSGTRAEAEKLGYAWVGDGFKVASDGKTLISADGLRQFRPPSFKPNLGREQANFERRLIPEGQWFGNGHLDVVP